MILNCLCCVIIIIIILVALLEFPNPSVQFVYFVVLPVELRLGCSPQDRYVAFQSVVLMKNKLRAFVSTGKAYRTCKRLPPL